jgi:hypothetical protein
MTKQEQLDVISESHINGQYKQMVEQIDEYLPAMFFQDYLEYMKEVGLPDWALLKYFANTVITYFKIKSMQGE